MVHSFRTTCCQFSQSACSSTFRIRRKRRFAIDISATRIWTRVSVLVGALLIASASQTGLAQNGPSSQPLQSHVPPLVSSHEARYVGVLSIERRMQLSIILPLRNQDQLQQLLTRLYDPASPDYHKFLSVDEFTAQFGPTEDDYQEVVQFAIANGLTVTGQPANRLVIPVNGTVDQVNRAFNVQLGEYLHPTEERTFYSPDREPTVPVRAKIAYIDGLSDLYLPRAMFTTPLTGQPMAAVNGSGPSGSYLGSDMRAAYYGGSILTGINQRVALVEFGGYLKSDVDLNFSGAGQTYTVPINNILVGSATNTVYQQDGEQVLDIVQAIGMAPGLASVDVYIGDPTSAASSGLVLNQIATDNLAKQIGCSWSWILSNIPAQEAILQEMAAQGQTFFAASGDAGAFQYSISPYFYPAESQFVTAVGGTHLTTTAAGGTWSAEAAWNSNGHGSGGGISPDKIAIPSWQTGLANSSNGGSSTLRNVPDVAMEGDYDNYICNLGSCFTTGAGTSFAAPRWAGFMALVNQQAVEAGNAPLGGIGFINTALTQIGTGANYGTDLHDIQSGNNNTANQTVWFSAVNGYDLVTGWGSPTGQSLIDDLAGKVVPGFWISSSSGTINVVEGATASATISIIGAGGFSDKVNLAITSTLPSGVTASFNPATATASSVLTFAASTSTAQGTYQVNITGTSGAITESTTVTLVVHGPSFSLSTSQSSFTINPGSSAISTITVNDLYGFTGNVSLQVNGLPTGLTASFGSNPTSATSVLTLTASSTAVAWSGFVTVVGTSGSLTASTYIYVNLVAPTFTLSMPTSFTIGQATTSNVSVYVNPQNGFTGSVTLSVSGLPNGVTALFVPNPITSSGAMTLIASGNAAVGSSFVTITGTSGGITKTFQVLLTVQPPGFTLSGGGSISIGQGTSGTSYIYVNDQYGFNGAVTLSATGLPSGVTASFSANPTTSSSIITFTATSTATPGSYTVTINGTSGSLTASTTVSLAVGAPTFTISAPTVTLSQSGTFSSYVYINSQFGFNGSVTFSASGLPAGVTASFGTNPATYSSQLNLTASSAAAVGSYSVTITGTSGSITRTATMPLTITAPGMQLSALSSVTLGIGTISSTQYVYVYGVNGFTGNVTLSVGGLPSGITASFSANPISLTGYSASTQLTFSATSSVTAGSYAVTLTATSGSVTTSTAITIVAAAPGFTLAGPSSLTIGQGATGSTYVSINAMNGFNSSVTLSVSGLPSGVTGAFTTNPATYSSSLNLSATNAAALGTYPITVTGTAGSLTATTTITLTVAAPAFTINLGSTSLGVNQGGSPYQSYLYVNGLNGFTGQVTLSASGLPSGVTVNFGTNPTSYYTTLTFAATSTATLGTSTVTITGTNGTITASANIALTVSAPSFTLAPASGMTIPPGGTEKSSIGIVDANGFNGVVTFSIAGLPSGVTASWNPASSTTGSTLTLTASSSAQPGSATATITGTSGALSATTPLAVTVRPAGNSSTTTLTIASGGSAVTSSAWGTLVNLSASVTSGGVPVKSGQVNFCDSTASYCGDIHLLGTAQLNSNGAASINLLPLPGNHSYTAVFTGTTANAASSSSSSSLQVTGAYPTATSISSSGSVGSYTLNAAVSGTGPQAPSGSISFVDTSNSNASIASGSLVAGSPAFTWSQFGLTPSGPSPNRLATGDFNGDGIGDVAVLNPNYNAIVIQLGNSDGTFTVGNLSPLTSPSPIAITTADFNGDGKLDLAVLTQNGIVNVFLGNGDGTFNAVGSSTNLAASTSAIASGDFNGDGIPDLVVANSNNGTLAVLLGKGDGTFTPATSSPTTGSGVNCIAVADFNGDGNLDVVVATYYGSITILLGSGDGNFSSVPNTLSVGTSPSAFVLGDFNRDGKPDLAVVSYYSASISILLGNGDGTFTATTGPATSNNPSYAVGLDINQDGIVDLVTLSQNTSNASIFLGKGDGTFTSAGTMTLPGATTGAMVGTVTNKGYPAIFASFGSLSQTGVFHPYFMQTATASATGVSMGATGSHKVAASYPGDATNAASQSQTITIYGTKSDSVITWATPAAIFYGTALDSTQLNATANVPGTFLYTPAAGAVLSAGTQTLSVTFTPTDSSYATVTSTVTLVVNKATPTITWATPSPIIYGTALGATQLNATSSIPGAYAYLPAAGTVPAIGSQILTVTFTPTDTVDYLTATASVTLTVKPASATISWATPSAIAYGTALSATQLNASSNLPGTFAYSPAAGTVLSAGAHTLTATFTPTDPTTYPTATATVTLTVNPATPSITWAAPPAIAYGTALSATQLNASSNVQGTFAYSPAAGTVLGTGAQTLSATFTPNDSADYIAATASVVLTVNSTTPTITWAAPSAISYGTALSATQLSASSTTAGSFSYTPTLGTVLPAGSQTLLVIFTPTDATDFIPTAKTVQLTVNKATTVVSVTASTAFQFQSNPVTFNAALAAAAAGGPPAGLITFYDGTTTLGTSSLANGTASYTTSSLGVGAHSITASYSGDSNYIAATSSSAVSETIGTMTITSTGSGGTSVDASPGGQAVFTLTLTPPTGQTFPQAIQLSISGLPSGANASFSPSSIPAGAGATNVTLTIGVPASASAKPLDNPFGNQSLPIALALVLLPFAVRFRKAGRKLQRGSHILLSFVAAIALATALVVGVSGCGGGSGGSGGNTTPRTYPLTLTATSGTYSQTTTLTLVVK